jgi:hypothetical protein
MALSTPTMIDDAINQAIGSLSDSPEPIQQQVSIGEGFVLYIFVSLPHTHFPSLPPYPL